MSYYASTKTFHSRGFIVEEAARTIGMFQTWCSQRHVGTQLGVSHSIIGRLLERLGQTNIVAQRLRSGRPKVTIVGKDRKT